MGESIARLPKRVKPSFAVGGTEVLELAEADELRERYPRIIKTLGDLV
jgi:hypothetical protein